MTRKDELLAAFDDALNHAWESIEYALSGLTDEEAAYQHKAYGDHPPEADGPLPGTALWHLVHLQGCYDYYTNGILSRPNAPVESSSTPATMLSDAIGNMKLSRLRPRTTIESLSEPQLDEALGSGRAVIELVRASIRHDAWHAGQIMVARRLWRNRPQ